MIERDYSGLFDFCGRPCELGDILQIVAIFGLLVLIVIGIFALVHYRSKFRGRYRFPGSGDM